MNRVVWIDQARGLAVILAMLSHSLTHFADNFTSLDRYMIWVNLLTRTATPTFVILFGIMIEVVYLRKARDPAKRGEAVSRLLSRMFTCYLLYVAITLAAGVTGKLDALVTLKSVLLLGSGRFGSILAIYAILFAFIVITLPLGLRFGSKFYLAVGLAGLAGKTVLDHFAAPALPGVQQLFGHGYGYGPAILLCFYFLAYGVALGEWLSGKNRRTVLLLSLLVPLGYIAFRLASDEPERFLYAMVYEHRWSNDLAYYAYGIVGCSLWLLTFARIWPAERDSKPANSLSFIGSETLLYYGLGNLLLNLLPGYNGQSAMALLLVAFGLVVLTVIVLHKGMVARILNAVTRRGFAKAHDLYKRMNALLVYISEVILGQVFDWVETNQSADARLGALGKSPKL